MAIRNITDDAVYSVVNSSNFANSDDESDGNILTDSARDLGVGLVDLGGAVAGAADFVASPFRDKGDSTFTQAYNDSFAGEWKRDLQEGYSDERKEAEREYEEYMARGDGSTMDQFGRAVFGLVSNPRAAIGRVFQAAPSMVAGGGVSGVVGKAALARGATTNAAKWAGRVGSGAAEGTISAGQVAGSVAEYNRENNLDPTQGVLAPVVTALGVGAIGTAGGGMEAGLFNKAVRSTVKQGGVGAIPKTFAKEGFKEGAEEAAQAPFETVPENVATGKQWDEGLGRGMGEGFATGFGLGGTLGTATKKNLLGDANEETTAKPYARDVPPQEEQPVDVEGTGVKFQPSGDMEADADRLIQEDTEEADGEDGAGEGSSLDGQGGSAPTAPKEAPTKVTIDANGYRDLFHNIHKPKNNVPSSQLKSLNSIYNSSPFGADVMEAVVGARHEVGSTMKAYELINIASEAVRKSGSIEDAVEYLRDQAKLSEKTAVANKESAIEADLYAVAAERLAGSSDTTNFLAGLREARVKKADQVAVKKAAQEFTGNADKERQKGIDAKKAAEEAQAAEKVDGDVVDENAPSKKEAAMARYREFKNGGKTPDTQQTATPTAPVTPNDEGITDIEGVEVQKEASTPDVLSPLQKGGKLADELVRIDGQLGTKTTRPKWANTNTIEDGKRAVADAPHGREVLDAIVEANREAGDDPMSAQNGAIGMLNWASKFGKAESMPQVIADLRRRAHETMDTVNNNVPPEAKLMLRVADILAQKYTSNEAPVQDATTEAPTTVETPTAKEGQPVAPTEPPKDLELTPIEKGEAIKPKRKRSSTKDKKAATVDDAQPSLFDEPEPQAAAPEESKPIDYDEKAPWLIEKPNRYDPPPVAIREGELSKGYSESGKLEGATTATAQPTAPKVAGEAAKPKKKRGATKAKKVQAVPNAAQAVVDKVEEETKAAEQAKAEGQTVPKEKQKEGGSGWISLGSGKQASAFNQTRMYENAFDDYKAQFKERPNGDTASLEEHVDAIDKVLAKMPKGEYYASALAVMANQAHTLSSDGITNRYRTWLAIAVKAKNLKDHDKKRVMDNVIAEAHKYGVPKEQIEVLRDPSKYRAQPTPKAEAKPTATPKVAPSGGSGGIDSQGMSDLAALGAKLSANKPEEAPQAKEEPAKAVEAPKAKEEPKKPVASIPTADTRVQEIETGEHVPTSVEPVATKSEPKREVAPVVKEAPKAEAPKGTAVGPAAKIEPINEADIPERLRMWSPNANVPAAKLKDGKSVFKSQEEALKAEMPKNMPKWAESTYNYVVHGFYPTNNRWPTQEEYRDDIWPELSREDSFLPDNAVELKTGRAWKRAWFGKITRGSQAVPTTGAKQAKADAKAQREATGRDLSVKLSKEWAQLAKEGKVAKGSKPQIHDVRAFLRRERESGAIDSGITIRHISKDVYEPILDTHAKSVFTHQANVAKVEAQKARELARANPEATKALPGNSQVKTESGTVAAAKDTAPAKQSGLPVPTTKAADDLIKTFPTLAHIKDPDTKGSQTGTPMLTADDEARTAMAADTIEEKLKGKTKQEEVDYLEDLLKDARSFPVTGEKATRFSVVAAVVSRVFRNTALPSRSAKRYNAEQYSQVIKAISDVLNEETSPLDVKTFKKLSVFKDSLAKQSTLGEDGVSALKRAMEDEEAEYGNDADTDDSFDSDDSGADATKGGPTENEMVGVFDDNTDEAEARQQAEAKAKHEEEFGRDTSEDEVATWDDDKVGGESGGSINVESGRTGHRVTRKAKRSLEDLARTFGWIDAKHKSGTGEKFDEVFEDTYEIIKERYEAASDEERQQVADAIKKWGKGIDYDKMHSEDILEVGIFAGTIGQELELGEANVVSEAAFDAYKAKITKPTEPTPPKDGKGKGNDNDNGNDGGDAKVQASEVEEPSKLSNIPTLKGLRLDSRPLPGFARAEYTAAVAHEATARKPKTKIGERLLKAARHIHVRRNLMPTQTDNALMWQAVGSGRALRFEDICSEATCADDLVGVYSEPFAKRLWATMQTLKRLGIKEIPNVWVADSASSTKLGFDYAFPGFERAVGSAGKCISLPEGAELAVYEDGAWKRFVVEEPSNVVIALYQGHKYSGVVKGMLNTLDDSTMLHEFVHALDNTSGEALSRVLGAQNPKALKQAYDLAKEINPILLYIKSGRIDYNKLDTLIETLPSANTVSKHDLAALCHSICYPFTFEGKERYRELLAIGVSEYVNSENYRNAVNELAPEFAKLLKGIIQNDIHVYHPVRSSSSTDASGSEIRAEAKASASEFRKDSDLHSGKNDGREQATVRNSRGSSPSDDHGNGKPRSQEEGASQLPGDANGGRGVSDARDAKPVRAGSRPHSPEMDGRTSAKPNPSDVSGKGRADVGQGSRGADPLRGPTPVESGSDPRKEKRSVDDKGAQPSDERVQQDQSRFYDIHHKVRKLSTKEWIQSAISNTFASAKNKGFLGLLFTRDLVSWATRAAPDVPAFKQWHELLERQAAFRNDWQADVANIKNEFDSIKDKKTRDTINEFLELTTIEGVWAYRDLVAFPNESDWRKYVDGLKDEKRESYNVLSDAYANLPDEAKAVVQKVLRHGIDARIKRAEMMKEHINDRFKRLEELASSQKEKDAVIKERDAQLKKFNNLAKQHRQPYVPLRRFGDHVVVVKSKKYEYTEQLANTVYRKLQKMYNGKPTPKQMSPFNKLRAELTKMQADQDHYVVQFVQGAGSAKMRAKTLQSQYPDSIVEHFARAEHVSSSIPSWQKLEQVITSAMEAMKAENIVADPQSNRNTQAALTELTNAAQRMYIEALNDDNARKGELRRMKVSGYHTNMMENFAEAGKAEANLYANMSYGTKVRKVLSDMQTEVRTSKHRTAAADYQNEIFRRHNQMLSNKEAGRGTNALLRTNSFVMLLTSPAYYVQNLMQPMMMSAPYMAGNHGMGASVVALNSAMAKAAKALRKGTSLDDIANGMGLSEEERAALVRARDLGHIDIGMSSDFGHVTHTDATRGEKALAFVTDKITEISRRVEMVNRIGTFVAAYRLERRRLGNGKNSAEVAWRYADEVVYKTHGDYSGINAPRLFTANTLARIATQFRKFQLIQAGMMIGLARKAFYDAPPLEKAIARRQLAWTMGIHFAMAGVKGTPFIGTILALWGFFFGGGDDEDDMIRDYIKDKETADILLNGIPKWLGIDMSQKVGAGNMLSPAPFLEFKPQNGEDFWKDIVVSLMGPTGSLGERAFRAIQYGYQGDYYKGIEAAAPTGVANVMKAFRFGTEGITTKAGDVHIPGEDFTFTELVAQAAGLPPNKITDRNRVMGSLIRHEEWYDKEQNQINHDYKEAFRARDTRGMMEARKRHRELNARRREEGFKTIPMSRLTRTATDQRKRELKGQRIGSTVGVKPSNRRFIQDQLEK